MEITFPKEEKITLVLEERPTFEVEISLYFPKLHSLLLGFPSKHMKTKG